MNRCELIINGIESQVLNFTDITTYKLLKQQEETTHLLKALNATVHHEMLAPLRCNIEICARLLKLLRNNEKAK